MKITTQAQMRRLFWEQHPQYKRLFIRMNKPGHFYRPLEQNEYQADVRMAWVDFVESCARSGLIDEAIASRAILK